MGRFSERIICENLYHGKIPFKKKNYKRFNHKSLKIYDSEKISL
jgi:hypothetical protein